MSNKKETRNNSIRVRVTEKELVIIREKFSNSVYRKFSDYHRKKLLDKPVKVFVRNKSMDEFMAEMIMLRNELNAIGNNYNQAVKKLHTIEHMTEVNSWFESHEKIYQPLLQKIDEIKSRITQFNTLWLQS
jgi:hypothetical protein